MYVFMNQLFCSLSYMSIKKNLEHKKKYQQQINLFRECIFVIIFPTVETHMIESSTESSIILNHSTYNI